MQKIIADLIKEFSKTGATKNEITIYLAGVFDGLELICKQLKGNNECNEGRNRSCISS